MRILFVSDYVPYPMTGGDRIRIYNLMRRVAREHEVWFAGFTSNDEEAEGAAHLREFCQRVETVEMVHRPRLARLPRKAAYALSGTPPDLEFLYAPELAHKVEQMAGAPGVDIVQVEHSRMALYLDHLPANGQLKRLLVLHNVGALQYQRIARLERSPVRRLRASLHSHMLRRWAPRRARQFDRCIAVSDVDRRLLLENNPGLEVDVVPNGVDIRHYEPLAMYTGQRPALLLIGTMSYAPNVDAALWTGSEILPRIRELVPDVELWLVGKEPPPEVVNLEGDGIHVTGQVLDVLPYYRKAAVSIVPLRAGSGTRLKILEAMALGRPVVSTTVGQEGLELVEGEHILIADDPEAFARQTARLLTDENLYRHIATQARELVERRYDWDAIAQRLMRLYDRIVEPEVSP
jgi:polysaccharide biosynthesis protein PslH